MSCRALPFCCASTRIVSKTVPAFPCGLSVLAGRCARCLPGQQPSADRTRCVECFEQYSADGHECNSCAPGHEVNLARTGW
eukprot:SAG22_NODE_33_length_27588_cov_104.174652_28_plen_81_part_00